MEIVLCHDRFSAGEPVFCVFVEAESQIGAGDVVYVPEAAGGEDAAGVVAALAGAAVEINRTVLRDFVQAVTDLREGDIDCIFDMPRCVFAGLADVDDGGTVFRKAAHGGDGNLPEFTMEKIQPHKAGKVDGILGGGKGRCIAEVDGSQVFQGSAFGDDRGNDVNAAVRCILSDGLCAQNAAGGLLKVNLQVKGRSTGHEADPVKGDDIGKVVRNAEGFDFLFIEPCRSAPEAEEFNAEAAQVSPARRRASADGIGSPAGLQLCREGKGEAARGPFQGKGDFCSISHGKDKGIGGAAVRINGNGTAFSDRQSRCTGKLSPGADADGHDDDIRRDDAPRGKTDGVLFHGSNAVMEDEPDVMIEHFLLENLYHVMVEGGENLICRFYEGNVQKGSQVGGGFRTDESASDDGGSADISAPDCFPDGSSVFRVFQGEDAGAVNAGNGRQDGSGTGRKDKEIIGFLIDGAVCPADADFLLFPKNIRGFGAGADVDAVLRPEAFRRHEEEGVRTDRAGEAVRKSTAGVGNMGTFFKEDDFCRFIQTAEPCCCGGAACHAADDEDFPCHRRLSPGAPFPRRCGRRS